MEGGFTLAWSFRNRKDILFNSIKTADRTCPKSVDFCLVDAASDEDTIKSLREFCNTISDRRIRICESTYRSSLSEAWNLCMMLTKNRYVIFASSDVVFLKEGWYDTIKHGLAMGQYVLMNNHAVFCIDKVIIPQVGWFDEDFIAGPHFDPDYMIRASENGIRIVNVGNFGFFVHGDEDDLEVSRERAKKEIKDRLPMNDYYNEDYFISKWKSDWPGWREANSRGDLHRPHPPTHISQVERLIPETDAHPLYTKKYYEYLTSRS